MRFSLIVILLYLFLLVHTHIRTLIRDATSWIDRRKSNLINYPLKTVTVERERRPKWDALMHYWRWKTFQPPHHNESSLFTHSVRFSIKTKGPPATFRTRRPQSSSPYFCFMIFFPLLVHFFATLNQLHIPNGAARNQLESDSLFPRTRVRRRLRRQVAGSCCFNICEDGYQAVWSCWVSDDWMDGCGWMAGLVDRLCDEMRWWWL